MTRWRLRKRHDARTRDAVVAPLLTVVRKTNGEEDVGTRRLPSSSAPHISTRAATNFRLLPPFCPTAAIFSDSDSVTNIHVLPCSFVSTVLTTSDATCSSVGYVIFYSGYD